MSKLSKKEQWKRLTKQLNENFDNSPEGVSVHIQTTQPVKGVTAEQLENARKQYKEIKDQGN